MTIPGLINGVRQTCELLDRILNGQNSGTEISAVLVCVTECERVFYMNAVLLRQESDVHGIQVHQSSDDSFSLFKRSRLLPQSILYLTPEDRIVVRHLVGALCNFLGALRTLSDESILVTGIRNDPGHNVLYVSSRGINLRDEWPWLWTEGQPYDDPRRETKQESEEYVP